MEFSIIIVNYRSENVLFDAVQTAIDHSTTDSLEIIVVSNSRLDNEDKSKLDPLKEVKVIQVDHNAGFAKACNQSAMHSKGNYLLFLNPDGALRNDVQYLSKTYMY